MRLRLLTLLICLLAVGCNKPDPNPEDQDPIYRDLKSELGFATKDADDAEKNVEEAAKDLEKVVPQTTDYKLKHLDFFKAKTALSVARQNVLIKQLAMQVRLKNDRHNYFEAFKVKKEWPDPGEFALYKKEKERKGATKSWDQALKQRLPASANDPKAKEAEKAAEKKPAAEGE